VNAAAIYGLASASLLAGAGVSYLPVPLRRQAGILVALVAPFTVAPLLDGLIGPMSFTLTQLALLRLCALEHVVMRGRVPAALLIALAIVFYPLAMGLGPFDPFDLGYRPRPLLALMIPFGILLACRREQSLLVIVGLDLFAYGLGLFDNLWSALFDPVVVILAGVWLATKHRERTAEDGSQRA
jgi:hypothetical protein